MAMCSNPNQPPLEHFASSRPSDTTSPHTKVPNDFDYALAAKALTDACARAGAAIMVHYAGNSEATLKADRSPVTQADKDAEAIMLAALHRLAPHISIVSEEDAADRTKALPRRFFLLDPLDGTKEFIQRRTDFTVNVALIEDGKPCFGIIYAPARKLLAVTISPGQALETELAPNVAGADLDRLPSQPLQVRPVPAEALVAVVSHSHLDAETENFLTSVRIAKRSSAGSSLKFLLVAQGLADVYPRFGPTMEWDIAAGHAILVAAGGEVVCADGAPLRYGKTEAGLRNPSFVAWGGRPRHSG